MLTHTCILTHACCSAFERKQRLPSAPRSTFCERSFRRRRRAHKYVSCEAFSLAFATFPFNKKVIAWVCIAWQGSESDKKRLLDAAQAEASTWKSLYLAGTQLDPSRVGQFLQVTSNK